MMVSITMTDHAAWRIGSDYNPIEGGLLPIGLAVLTLSPLLAARLRRARAS
jgi:hypothetical protein